MPLLGDLGCRAEMRPVRPRHNSHGSPSVLPGLNHCGGSGPPRAPEHRPDQL